jgi:hypothetical protein
VLGCQFWQAVLENSANREEGAENHDNAIKVIEVTKTEINAVEYT